jgi:hypothetical protein
MQLQCHNTASPADCLIKNILRHAAIGTSLGHVAAARHHQIDRAAVLQAQPVPAVDHAVTSGSAQ